MSTTGRHFESLAARVRTRRVGGARGRAAASRRRARSRRRAIARVGSRAMTFDAPTHAVTLRDREDGLRAVLDACDRELRAFLAQKYPDEVDLDVFPRCVRTKAADACVQWAQFASKRKMNPAAVAAEVAAEFQSAIEARRERGTIVACEATGVYLNLKLNRPMVFEAVMKSVARQGATFGHTDAAKGKRVIIEHTSSNPNAPLHIGNLRNVMIGAHLGRLMKACGHNVQEAFYVNDLGAQIGLTALAYSRVYDKLEPFLKIDHWIGAMYAVMNTCQELQQVGVNPGDLEDACVAGKDAVDALMKKSLEAVAGDADKEKGVTEYFDIYQDLRGRFEKIMKVMLEDVRTIPDIKVEAGKLNLAYEKQEPWAIKIFRRMVCDCLTGVQQTLSTYGVQHDRFDFESELGWEGSNDKVLEIMQNSDYYVPQTQCNEKGVPQGAYLDMASFITDMGFKIGKGGYQKDYPPLYVLRPDGSTLYTYRDIVYSFKKASMSDLILNIICSEQDLAQQKVALAMAMMNPEMEGRQYHLSYDLVKLTTGKMSGRRGRYLLADDLYEDLKEVIREKMENKYKEKGEDISKEMFDAVTHEVSTAAMKYALLSVSCMTQINFDIAKITDFEDASAPFILYNSTRLTSVLRKFEERSAAGVLEKLCPLEDVDFSKLDDDREWALLLDFVLPFSSMIIECAMPPLPKPPALPSYGMHRVCDFLNMMVRALSGYYGPAGVRMMPVQSQLDAGWNETPSMHARIHACKMFKQVIDNGLRLLMIEPLERM